MTSEQSEEPETENIQAVNREEVEAYAAEYANTKPLGF